MKCPNGHEMRLINKLDKAKVHGVSVQFDAEHYFCPTCKIEVDTMPMAAKNQRALSDAYKKAVGLLTSEEIKRERKRLGWSQGDLAEALNVGIASVKRWETGHIQTRSMDTLLRSIFAQNKVAVKAGGNRNLSLARIKLALKQFEKALNRSLLKRNDRMLYAAKYLWYADMASFRDLGQSITGATYAALPHGPQLNNYKDLVPLIIDADEKEAEALEPQEIRIIERIAVRFPSNQSIYKAVHDEDIFRSKPTGELIPYTDAEKIKYV
ncbi:MAG: DUF4065 domain-containing protein [Deltaproteobacteria bacterium]|nr:DUF4065 domain-containing protein [Deltaproteobacteria bacterium]